MKKPAQADLQRWSDEVAKDPASLAFLPLARAYRRQGESAAARELCLRGLQFYPTHVEAHSLLALLYLEAGDRARAADEWSMVLRMDSDHFEALRGIGFCYLEQDQLSRARQSLERAALLRPQDPAVREALNVLGTRQEIQAGAVQTTAGADDVYDEPWAAAPDSAGTQSAATLPGGAAGDPAAVFDAMSGAGPLLGVLLLDPQGLVLAGSLRDSDGGSGEALGATLGPAISEAIRTVGHLSLGDWRGMLLEADTAVLHVSPVRDDAFVLLAAQRTAPTGWVLRCAAQAGDIAGRYLETYA